MNRLSALNYYVISWPNLISLTYSLESDPGGKTDKTEEFKHYVQIQTNKQQQKAPHFKKSESCSVLSESLLFHGLGPLGSSAHGTHKARMLEWVAISFSRGSSQPRNWTLVSGIAGSFFTIWATGEALTLRKKLSN